MLKGRIPPLTERAQAWSKRLRPLMRLLMWATCGDIKESPQETHRWNNHKFLPREDEWLRHLQGLTTVIGDPNASPKWYYLRLFFRIYSIPLFHLGGWKEYVVFEPLEVSDREWLILWIPHLQEDVSGVSLLPINGRVRVLRGQKLCHFIGLRQKVDNPSDWEPVPLQKVAHGRLGDRSEYRKVPLR